MGLPTEAPEGAEVGTRNVRVIRMTANHSATPRTTAIATKPSARFSRLIGVVGLKRP